MAIRDPIFGAPPFVCNFRCIIYGRFNEPRKRNEREANDEEDDERRRRRRDAPGSERIIFNYPSQREVGLPAGSLEPAYRRSGRPGVLSSPRHRPIVAPQCPLAYHSLITGGMLLDVATPPDRGELRHPPIILSFRRTLFSFWLLVSSFSSRFMTNGHFVRSIFVHMVL